MSEPLLRIIRNSGKNWSGITVDVERIVGCCKICSLHKLKPNRKHVCLPRAEDFNQVESLDLVDMGHSVWILYCIDEFNRLTKGTILKDKSAKSVVNGILDCWIYGGGMGPGPPLKCFFADHGLEFINSEVISLCEVNGIHLKILSRIPHGKTV